MLGQLPTPNVLNPPIHKRIDHVVDVGTGDLLNTLAIALNGSAVA